MGQLIHPRANPLTKTQQLIRKRVQRYSHRRRTREQRDRTALQILAHILQIVAQLQQHAPIESEPALIFIQLATRQASIRQHRTPTLRATNLQNLSISRSNIPPHLRHTSLLSTMDRQQAVKNLRIFRTRILPLNQLHQSPQRSLVSILSRKFFALQPSPETLAEPSLLLVGHIPSIQKIIGIRIQQAIPQD